MTTTSVIYCNNYLGFLTLRLFQISRHPLHTSSSTPTSASHVMHTNAMPVISSIPSIV